MPVALLTQSSPDRAQNDEPQQMGPELSLPGGYALTLLREASAKRYRVGRRPVFGRR
jgi:hypothetical protein